MKNYINTKEVFCSGTAIVYGLGTVCINFGEELQNVSLDINLNVDGRQTNNKNQDPEVVLHKHDTPCGKKYVLVLTNILNGIGIVDYPIDVFDGRKLLLHLLLKREYKDQLSAIYYNLVWENR